jgi:hypothetical protein
VSHLIFFLCSGLPAARRRGTRPSQATAAAVRAPGVSSAAAHRRPHDREHELCRRPRRAHRNRLTSFTRQERETEGRNGSRATSSLEIRRMKGTHIWRVYSPGSCFAPAAPIQTAVGARRLRSAPAALKPNTRLEDQIQRVVGFRLL